MLKRRAQALAAALVREGHRLNNEGARAMLDQLPTTTPSARAIANQNKVDPPKKIKANKGSNVVPLVYSVRVSVAETARSTWTVSGRSASSR